MEETDEIITQCEQSAWHVRRAIDDLSQKAKDHPYEVAVDIPYIKLLIRDLGYIVSRTEYTTRNRRSALNGTNGI